MELKLTEIALNRSKPGNLLKSYVNWCGNKRLLESWEINIRQESAQSVLNKLKICTFLYIHPAL